MDWLEQWFGFAPDNGDGSVELLILLTVLFVGVVFVIWRHPISRAAVLRFLAHTVAATRTLFLRGTGL